MSALEIIKAHMTKFKNLNNNNSIKFAYYYASPENKSNTGPLQNFNKMIKLSYPQLLDFDSYILGDVIKNTKKIYIRDIIAVKNTIMTKFRFKLSKQVGNDLGEFKYDKFHKIYLKNVWRVDSVLRAGDKQLNIFDKPLEVCSKNPLTGYYRDGYCKTDSTDFGSHTVCAQVNNRFLNYTKNKGNDLTLPNTKYNFGGLKDGDYWCLCANRYKEAHQDGIKLKTKKRATHKKTLNYLNIADL
uniref:Uncharacterized protein n=1 Tax=viral metagenome TaxID=1070528 RepID=A0A6C0IWB7_9ZZZZ